MENKMRNTLNEIYFGKTKDIVNGLRSTTQLQDLRQRDNLQKDLANALRNRNAQASNWSHDRFTFVQIVNFKFSAACSSIYW